MLAAARNPYPKVIFVMGPPGSGKTSQCERIAKEFGLTHVNMGDLLRKERETDSAHSDMIAAMIRTGEFVPKDITVGLLAEVINKNPNKKGFVFDGFPRNMEQATYFEEVVGQCRFVIMLEASESVLEKRLLKRSGLQQGNQEAIDGIRKRMRKFDEHTAPVVSYYDRQGILHKISAGTEEDVYADVRPLFETVPDGALDMSKQQSILDVEPIYCAEQIVIPPDLPAILKEWSKAVIRAKPDDILKYSANYFAQKAREAPLVLEVNQLYNFQRTMQTGEQDVVSRSDIERACAHVGIEKSVVDHVFRIRNFGGQVNWAQFAVVMATMIAEDITHTVELIFDIFGRDSDYQLQVKIFLHLLSFIAEIDETITEQVTSELTSRLTAVVGGMDSKITFQHFVDAFDGLVSF